MLNSILTTEQSLSAAALPKLSPLEVEREALSEISDFENRSSDTVRRIYARRLVEHCGSRYEIALQTVGELELDDKKLNKFSKDLKSEFYRYVQICELYARGYSYRWIQEKLNEPAEQRIGLGCLPPGIKRFAGLELSRSESAQRERTGSARLSRVLDAYRVALRRLDGLDGAKVQARKERLEKELRKFNQIVSLYQRGLAAADIAELTNTPADKWLLRGSLPQAIEKASRSLLRPAFKVRTSFDQDMAYIAGAYFASFSVFSPTKVLTFQSASPHKLNALRDRFLSSFNVKGSAVIRRTDVHDRFTFTIGQRKFTRYLYEFLKVNDRTNPGLPLASFETEENRRSLLKGFFDFTTITLGSIRPGIAISRANQINILHSVACALYLENIYPLVGEIKKGTYLHINTHADLKKLLVLFPQLTSEEKLNQLRELLSNSGAEQLNSYREYSAILKVLKTNYSDGKEIDFSRLCELAAIEIEPEKIDANLRRKIRDWRCGAKPLFAVRAERIEGFIQDLYWREGGIVAFKKLLSSAK